MKFNPHLRRHCGRSAERGYILIVLMLFVTLLVIGLTAAAPSIAQQIRRQREIELIHRGTQYARAIKRFYKKFGRYPTRLEELENTNNIRFLRRRYKDPMTADGQWRIIHFGEAKLNLPQGGPVLPGASVPGATSPAPGPTTPSTSATPQGQQPGTPAAQFGTLQPGGPTFGGGPIVGVASTNEKASIKEIKGKSHYNEWEFVYDPQLDLSNQPAGVPGPATLAPGAQPQSGPGTQPGPGMPGPQPPPQPPTRPQ